MSACLCICVCVSVCECVCVYECVCVCVCADLRAEVHFLLVMRMIVKDGRCRGP